jgi:hypothetical protein
MFMPSCSSLQITVHTLCFWCSRELLEEHHFIVAHLVRGSQKELLRAGLEQQAIPLL